MSQEVSESVERTWEVVYIGASWLSGATRMYAEYIEADLGVDVFFISCQKDRVLWLT